jgi:hypothetical protein
MTGIQRYRTNTLRTFAIGDIGPAGGFIFATPSTSGNATGKYFEAAPYQWNGSGADPTRTWAETTYQTVNVSGATGTAYGSGYNNTLAIIAQGNANTATSAAALARSCTSGGKNDWFLPSQEELGKLLDALYYSNGDIGGLNNPSNPGSANYWSSTQETSTAFGDPASRAVMSFWAGDAGPLKSDLYSVRPVRMFAVEYSSSVQRIGNDSIYGTGSDGTVIIASNTSLSRDMYYDNLTINTGVHLNTNGYRVFVKNALTLTGNIGVNSSQTVSTGTISGAVALGFGSITKAIGGNSGGNTFTASQITDSDKKNIEALVSGIVIDSSGVISAIRGGSSGALGTPGVLTPATSGGTGELTRNPLAPGGPGTPGTSVPIATGGDGGTGGPVVAVIAKIINGSGSILAQGRNATEGQPSAVGTPGAAAPNQPLTHNVDGSAHYITGDGSTGPHATTTTPNVPHGGPGNSVAATQNNRHGSTDHHIHRGTLHHHNCTGDCASFCPGGPPLFHGPHYGHGPDTIGFNNPNNVGGPHSGTHGHFNNDAHVNSLTGTYHNINNVNHTPGHRGNIGEARISDGSHTGAFYHVGHDVPHVGVAHNPGHTVLNDKYGACGANHISASWPRHHYQQDHAAFRARTAGTVSHGGSVIKTGGSAGAAGSTTSGSNGITGGGGGIIIITDSIANTVVTSVTGGTGGTGAGQPGSVITILNT